MAYPFHERRRVAAVAYCVFCRMTPTNGRSFAIIRNRQFKLCVRRIVLAQVKPGKFYCESRRSGECAPLGASSFVVSRRAFPGPHRSRGRGLCPLSFAVNMTRAKGKNGNRSVRKAGSGRTARKPRSARGGEKRRLLRTEDRARPGTHARRRWLSTSLPN